MPSFKITIGLLVTLLLGSIQPSSLYAQVTNPGAVDLPLPADAAVNVKTEYGAVGDGVTDDTDALLAALADRPTPPNSDPSFYFGRPRAVLLPAGTYLVSDTIEWPGCCLTLVGEGPGQTVIRLANNTAGFNDPNNPRPVLKTGPDGNKAFRQNIWNLTVETGSGNPGAVGVDFLSSNTGTLRGVHIRSGDGSGVAGLDLSRRWPGPQYMRDIVVNGFDYGVRIQEPIYGPVFENITVSNQNVAGVLHRANATSIRGLTSNNSVPALISTGNLGSVILIDSTLSGGSSSVSAIQSTEADLFVRNVQTSGYQSAIHDNGTVVPGNNIDEYVSGQVQTLFDGTSQRSLNLPIKNTPFFHDTNLNNWGKYVPTSDQNRRNNLARVQALADSGVSTIYFTPGSSPFDGTLNVPPTLRRVVSYGHVVNNYDGVGLRFRIDTPGENPFILEGFGYGTRIEHNANRDVVIKHGSIGYTELDGAQGDVFIEDVVRAPITFSRVNLWARQLNMESLGIPGTENRISLTNDGTDVWLFGVKTEGESTVVLTRNGGRTELLGTLLYPVDDFDDPNRAAFIIEDGTMTFTMGMRGLVTEIYPNWVRETQQGVTRTLPVVYNPSDPPNFTPNLALFVAETTIQADINEDGFITPSDALFVLNRVGQPGNNEPRADLDGNGIINLQDAFFFVSRLGQRAR